MFRASLILLLLAVSAGIAVVLLSSQTTAPELIVDVPEGGVGSAAPAPAVAAEIPIAVPTGAAPVAGAISGRVYDRGDVPLPGANLRIELKTPPGTRNFSLARTFDEVLKADDEGRFRVEVPGGGVYRVTAETPGFAAARHDGVLPGHTIEFHLPAGARLHGVVLRESDRQPIEGVEIGGVTAAGTSIQVKSDATGGFFFSDLPAGVLTLEAEHALFLSRPSLEVAIEEAGSHALEILLSEGKVISGRVVARDGALPLADASVTYRKKVAVTDAAGRYRLAGLPADSVGLTASADGYLVASTQVNLAGSREAAEADFELSSGAEVRGVVLNDRYAPIEGARVRLFQSWGERGWGWGGGSESVIWEDGTTRSTRILTDSEGKFRIRGIAPQGWARYLVRAEFPGVPEVSKDGIEIKSASDVIHTELILGVGGAARGIVLDDTTGRPVAGARVSITLANQYSEDVPGAVVGSDAEGRFAIAGLSEGTHTLRVDAVGFPPLTKGSLKIRRDAELDLFEVRLPAAHTVSGIVKDKEGVPLAGAEVGLQASNSDGRAVSGADGRFSIAAIAEGPYRVWANKSGYAHYSKRSVTPDPETGIEIEMSPQPTLRGLVLDAKTKEPITRYQLFIVEKGNPSGDRRRTQRMDMTVDAKDGRFSYQIDPGQWTVRVTAKGYVPLEQTSKTLSVDEESEPMEFLLGSGAALEGYVRGSDGRPLAGVNMYHRSGDDAGFQSRGETERDGYFYIGDLASGQHALVARASGYPVRELGGLYVETGNILREDINLEHFTQLVISWRKESPPEEERPAAVRSRRSASAGITIQSLDEQPMAFDRHRDANGLRAYRFGFERGFGLRESRPGRYTDLHPGRYRVRATLSGYPPQERIVSLNFGLTTEIEFLFETGKPVTSRPTTPPR